MRNRSTNKVADAAAKMVLNSNSSFVYDEFDGAYVPPAILEKPFRLVS